MAPETPTHDMTAAEVIALLGLAPHPEGGHFRETFRDVENAGDGGLAGRAASTAIYFLLAAGERSHWHRVDAAETWHFYAGAPLRLMTAPDGMVATTALLGVNLAGGERPQAVVPGNVWQSAESLGRWSLCGCTVAPGFSFDGFEVARDGWTPGGGS